MPTVKKPSKKQIEILDKIKRNFSPVFELIDKGLSKEFIAQNYAQKWVFQFNETQSFDDLTQNQFVQLIQLLTSLASKCPKNKIAFCKNPEIAKHLVSRLPLLQDVESQVDILSFIFRITPADQEVKKTFIQHIGLPLTFTQVPGANFRKTCRSWLFTFNSKSQFPHPRLSGALIRVSEGDSKFKDITSSVVPVDCNQNGLFVPSVLDSQIELDMPFDMMSRWRIRDRQDLIELEIQMEDDWKMSNDGYVSVLLALDDVSYNTVRGFLDKAKVEFFSQKASFAYQEVTTIAAQTEGEISDRHRNERWTKELEQESRRGSDDATLSFDKRNVQVPSDGSSASSLSSASSRTGSISKGDERPKDSSSSPDFLDKSVHAPPPSEMIPQPPGPEPEVTRQESPEKEESIQNKESVVDQDQASLPPPGQKRMQIASPLKESQRLDVGASLSSSSFPASAPLPVEVEIQVKKTHAVTSKPWMAKKHVKDAVSKPSIGKSKADVDFQNELIMGLQGKTSDRESVGDVEAHIYRTNVSSPIKPKVVPLPKEKSTVSGAQKRKSAIIEAIDKDISSHHEADDESYHEKRPTRSKTAAASKKKSEVPVESARPKPKVPVERARPKPKAHVEPARPKPQADTSRPKPQAQVTEIESSRLEADLVESTVKASKPPKSKKSVQEHEKQKSKMEKSTDQGNIDIESSERLVKEKRKADEFDEPIVPKPFTKRPSIDLMFPPTKKIALEHPTVVQTPQTHRAALPLGEGSIPKYHSSALKRAMAKSSKIDHRLDLGKEVARGKTYSPLDLHAATVHEDTPTSQADAKLSVILKRLVNSCESYIENSVAVINNRVDERLGVKNQYATAMHEHIKKRIELSMAYANELMTLKSRLKNVADLSF